MALYDSRGNMILPMGPSMADSVVHSLPHLGGRIPDGANPRLAGEYQRWRQMTVDEMLLENRVIFLVGEINYSSAMNVIMRLLYLQSLRKDQDIHLYINSPGGSVDDTLAMYDTMKFLSCDVCTYFAASSRFG